MGSWELNKLDLYFIYLFCQDVFASDSSACIILSMSNRQSAAVSAHFQKAVSKVKIYMMCISALSKKKTKLKIRCKLRYNTFFPFTLHYCHSNSNGSGDYTT